MKAFLRIRTIFVLGLLCFSAIVSAQSAAEIGQRMGQNAKALMNYSWKMRTELKMGGETKNTSVQLLRFDVDGKIQKTPLSAPPQPKKAKGIKGRKMKQKDEMQQLIQGLSQTAMAYIHPNPNQLDAFLQKANVWEGKAGATGGSMRIEGNGFVAPQDMVNLNVDSTTKRPLKMEAKTMFQEKPLQITAEYRDLTGGPTYIARMTMDYPEAKVQLVVENFDYTKQN